ncbi:MAG: ABC transporter ATPase [Bacteroidia bacterium]|nr:ABC transporter ATPase [Bacteroidia bacterium]NND11224.1 ABC transporter ATPase [Flavobacteriaceae bacterium]MBT8310659.1 ABC transporter ATPase [Bacteroidia bacterium]NNK28490.1 ABC transporter ATPase [Flavobacteriaceae bacterium]NNL60277.1 ABC transporter ATPase [Flavobacteriaceae bacterium]
MVVDFDKLPDSSRVWIYQANRSLSEKELEEVSGKTKQFLGQWTAHGSNLKAGYEIKYKRFIVIALDEDETSASGCSIDASVNFIQGLEKEYDIDLLDKMNVSYKQGEFIAYKALKDFRKMAKQKAVSKNTIVFNNLVTNLAEYKNNWEVPASESWHNRFLK